MERATAAAAILDTLIFPPLGVPYGHPDDLKASNVPMFFPFSRGEKPDERARL
jgi:hypothetical protein